MSGQPQTTNASWNASRAASGEGTGSVRLRQHLLYRLRHVARLKAIEDAIARGLLAEAGKDDAPCDGGRTTKGGKRRIRPPQAEEDDDRFWPVSGDRADEEPGRRIVLGPLLRGRLRHDAACILLRHGLVLSSPAERTDRRAGERPLSAGEVWQLVRDAAMPPHADEIAVVLLLAAALDCAGIGEGAWRRVMSSRTWMATVLSPVDGFVLRLIRMLKSGSLGHAHPVFDGYELRKDLDALPSRYVKGGSLIVFRGEEEDSHAAVEREMQTGLAARLGYPVLGIASEADHLPRRLLQATQLRLETGPLTSAIVAAVMKDVLGIVPDDIVETCAARLPDDACAVLSLHDLAVAVRPGIPVNDVVGTLRRLAGVEEDGGAGSAVGPAASGPVRVTSSHGERGRNGRKVFSGNEIVQPVPDPVLAGKSAAASGPAAAPTAVTVETLHGYGLAKDWALDLKADLALWRAGRLPWSQMSTKLLLSGPPGTGKTTYARALCNTLQIPLAVTSVSTWLEPGYLGDVIRRMRISFEEAQQHAPAILFVDEIDGIGKRGQNNEYDDYWNAVVNKLLELLDGAIRSEGLIIVGATNHPDVIDPALLRSGRLETRFEIPLPDVDALVGILAHHLGNDCPAVIGTRPQKLETDASPPSDDDGGAAASQDKAEAGQERGLLPDAGTLPGGNPPRPTDPATSSQEAADAGV